MGLYIVIMRETTGLKLSWCSRQDTQISISVRMTVGNKFNNYACEGLSRFGWQCKVLVWRCVLSGDARNQRGCFLLSACPHPVFLAKSRGVVMFSEICGVFVNDVKKCVWVLIIDVCIKYIGIHMEEFICGILCTSAHGYIFIYILVWDCIQSRVTWGGIFGWCFLLWKSANDLRLSGHSCS